MYIGTRHMRGTASILLAFAIAVALLFTPDPSGAGVVTTPVGLGAAGAYSVLAGSAVTNTGASVLHGSLGLHPESAVTGFTFSTSPGPGQVLGDVNIANVDASEAKDALTAAYGDAAGRTLTSAPTAALADTTLFPGVHGSAAALTVSGTLTLDAQGDPTAVFIIKAETAELTFSGSVQLEGNAQACNVFWQVGTSATVGSGSSFVGTILAAASITVVSSAVIEGRALAQSGAVTLDTNEIFQPGCDLAAGGGGATTTTTAGGGATTTTTAGGGATTTTTAGGDDELPATGGGPVLPILIGGLALLVAGGGTVVLGKRRRAGLL